MTTIPPDDSPDRTRGAAQTTGSTGGAKGTFVPSLGVTIDEILLVNDKVKVFIDERGNLQWLFDQQPPDSAWVYARVSELEAKCGFFKESGLPWFLRGLKMWEPMNHQRSAKRAIGQGVVIILTGGTKTEAETAFNSAEAFILQRGREASLNWLYVTFTILAGISVVALLLLVFLTNGTQSRLPLSVLACAAGGGIGAYISRALASRSDLPCDANAGCHLHIQEAILRWSVGVVAGGLVCVLVKGQVLLGSVKVDATGFPVVLALAVLSGMSERFLPTLLNRFNDQLAEPEAKKSPPAAAPGARETAKKAAEAARATANEARSKATAADQAARDAQSRIATADDAAKPAAEQAYQEALAAAELAKNAASTAEIVATKAEETAK